MDLHALYFNAWHYIYANQNAIISYFAAGGGVSVLLQLIKKMRKWQRDAWIQFALGVFTIAASTADYVIQNYTSAALPTIFGDMAPKLLAAAMIMHRIAVNPLSKLIEKRVEASITKRTAKKANAVSVTGQITPHVTTVSPDPDASAQDVL